MKNEDDDLYYETRPALDAPTGPRPRNIEWAQACARLTRALWPELERRFGKNVMGRVSLRYTPDENGNPTPSVVPRHRPRGLTLVEAQAKQVAVERTIARDARTAGLLMSRRRLGALRAAVWDAEEDAATGSVTARRRLGRMQVAVWDAEAALPRGQRC